jgi:hypothetical protein
VEEFRMRGALASLLLLSSLAAAGDTMRTQAAGLRFVIPTAWTRTPAGSDVRAAQYTIPRAGGASEDGELVLFFFGAGQGGGTQENLERWYGQFAQPDGRPSRDAAVVTMRTVNQLKVTSVDLSGTYLGGPNQRVDKPGFRLLAAAVEGEGGPWFFKAVGPAATIEAAKAGFDALLASVERH